MLSEKENMLRFLRKQDYEYDPGSFMVSTGDFGVFQHADMPVCERPYKTSGYDVFGVHWSAATPASHVTPGQKPMYDDIEDWEEQVHIPDPTRIDWFACKADVEKRVDRENRLLKVVSLTGPFERSSVLTSFEDCLCNAMEDPEAYSDLIGAIADYKIEVVKKAFDELHPDVFAMHDDWGTSTSTFFNPDDWRKLVKPHIKRICDEIRDRGMIAIIHSCGCVSPLVPDMIDCGFDAWEAQASCVTDEALAYKDRIAIVLPDVEKRNKLIEEGRASIWQPVPGYDEPPAWLWK